MSFLGRLRDVAFCVTCQKPVEQITAMAQVDMSMRVMFACHGQEEFVDVSDSSMMLHPHLAAERIGRAFLRPWAKYGQVSQAGRFFLMLRRRR